MGVEPVLPLATRRRVLLQAELHLAIGPYAHAGDWRIHKPDDAVWPIDRRRLAGQIARDRRRPIRLNYAGQTLLILGLLRRGEILGVLAILARPRIAWRSGGRRGLAAGAFDGPGVLLLELAFERANALLHLL